MTRVEVSWLANETVHNDVFHAAHASVTVLRGGRAVILLTGGSDESGPVESAQYASVCRVVRRPVDREDERCL